ncbi:MAG: (Fe-S)-binding protein [Candidatus Odinarchaeia archaeon]
MFEEFYEELLKCNFQKCAECKYGCPVYAELGFISTCARGRMNVLKAVSDKFIEVSPSVVELAYKCALCGYCESRCNMNINLTELFRMWRNYLVTSSYTSNLKHREYVNLVLKQGNPYGKPKSDREKIFQNSIFSPESPNLFFAGCNAVYLAPEIGEATAKILGESSINFNYLGEDESCCGNLLYTLGYWNEFKELAESNVKKFKMHNVERIVTPCPGCYRIFETVYPKFVSEFNVKTQHISQFIYSLLEENRIVFRNSISAKIAFHDPCDLGRGMNVYNEPRMILKKIPEVKLVEFSWMKEFSHCCGGGGGLLISFKNLAFSIAESRLKEIENAKVDMIVSSCPLCTSMFKTAVELLGLEIEVKDLTLLVAEAANLI